MNSVLVPKKVALPKENLPAIKLIALPLLLVVNCALMHGKVSFLSKAAIRFDTPRFRTQPVASDSKIFAHDRRNVSSLNMQLELSKRKYSREE